jgi:hypothetical protein
LTSAAITVSVFVTGDKFTVDNIGTGGVTVIASVIDTDGKFAAGG